MAAALECWSSRANTEEDLVEQVLIITEDRSETLSGKSSSATNAKDSSAIQKRLQRLSRNVSEAISSLKHSFSLDSTRDFHSPRIDSCRKVVWGNVVRNLTQLYPGSQLPEKLVSNIRKHYDSLPLSYAQADFNMEDVFLHIRLIEQASVDDHPAISIEEVFNDENHGSIFKLTFVCNSSISWPTMYDALDNASICCKKIQIFEKKGFTLGAVKLLVQSGQQTFKYRIESALKLSLKKPKPTTMKLAFGLCGCQEEDTKGIEVGEIDEHNSNGTESSSHRVQLQMPLPSSSFVISVDEWQTIQSGGDGIKKWLLNSEHLEFSEQIEFNTFKGTYKGRRVGIEKVKGCDRGKSYEFNIQKDLLELMTCGHRNILQFFGVCIDENHGLCVVTKMMEGGTLQDLILMNNRLQTKEVIRIAVDLAQGIKFLNDHGIAFRDLNTQRILLDQHGNACLGDMGIVIACNGVGETIEYETDGYRWLAPEIIAGDPENVKETWMSNAYSFGMVIWEMVAGEAAYAACSPVQAAVGIAACGLRPEIPPNSPQFLKSLMTKCWNNSPSKRPQFSEIISLLTQFANNCN